VESKLNCHHCLPFGRYILLSEAGNDSQVPVLSNNPPSDQRFPGTGQAVGP